MTTKQRAISDIRWSLLSAVKIVAIGALQLSLLAQVLGEGEFDMLATSIIMLLILDTLCDRGFSNKIIRRHILNKNQLSTLYWFNIISGLAFFAVLFIGSDVISRFSGQPELGLMIEMLSLVFIIIPQGQHYRAILQKERHFTRIALTETAAVITGMTATLITVWLSPSILCAVWGYLAMVSVRTLMFCCYGREYFQAEFVFNMKSLSSLRRTR